MQSPFSVFIFINRVFGRLPYSAWWTTLSTLVDILVYQARLPYPPNRYHIPINKP